LLAITQFGQVAEALSDSFAGLLGTYTYVLDATGVVRASSEWNAIGHSFAQCRRPTTEPLLRVQFRCDTQAGEVIVGEPLNGETISPRLAQALVELVINKTNMQQLPNQHELKNSFIYNVLHGVLDDEATILDQATVLGIDLGPPRAVILIDAAEYILTTPDGDQHSEGDTPEWRRAQIVIGSVVDFFCLPSDLICAYIGNGEVAVLKASNTNNLAVWADTSPTSDHPNSSWANLAALQRASGALLTYVRSDTGASVSIGIGRYHPGINGLARSYQDARAALLLGRRFHGHNQAHCLDQLGIAAFVGVSDERTKVELATYLLSPLDHDCDLLKTLEVFFANNCCPLVTAQQLAIHRNTLTYRLNKVTSLTGLDPCCFDDAVQIRLVLLLRSLRDQSTT
jgi:carbohydrate diacid regulator